MDRIIDYVTVTIAGISGVAGTAVERTGDEQVSVTSTFGKQATLIEQGGKAAIAANAGIGAATNVAGDTATKVITGQEVTVGSTATAIGTGAFGANVFSTSKVIPSIVTEGLNAVIPIIEKTLSDKKGN